MKLTIHPNVEEVIYILAGKKKMIGMNYIKNMLINKNICVLILNMIIFFKIYIYILKEAHVCLSMNRIRS